MNLNKIFILENVSFKYPQSIQPIFKNINLEIYENDFIVVLGANGSGKSTFLKILNGLIFPNEGKITAFGKELSEESLSRGEFRFFFRKEVALLFQNPDAHLICPTIYEELSFTVKQLGLKEDEIEERIKDVIELLKINLDLNRIPYSLSEGEKKLIAFASMLPQNPSVFLIDELSSNLDPKRNRFFERILKNLNEIGKTIILTTHDINQAKNLGKKVFLTSKSNNILIFENINKLLNDEKLLSNEDLI